MTLSTREKFVILISNDTLKKSDAIIILEGDGLNRIRWAGELFKNKWAPKVVISGGIDKKPHSIPAGEMFQSLLDEGVPQESILLEEKSLNTREQGVEIMKMVKDRNWKSIILAASHYHQYRAYLTFLKTMYEANLKISIINSPVRDLPWFQSSEEAGGKRFDILEKEFEKIEKYGKEMGHQATFEEAIDYQIWKENQK